MLLGHLLPRLQQANKTRRMIDHINTVGIWIRDQAEQMIQTETFRGSWGTARILLALTGWGGGVGRDIGKSQTKQDLIVYIACVFFSNKC